MKLWGAYFGAVVVSAIAGCGGDFRSGTGSRDVDAGETGGKPDTGGGGSAESGGAISDGGAAGSAGKASGGRAGHGGAGNGGASSGGKAGAANGGSSNGGVAGSSSGGSGAGGATGGAGSGGVGAGGSIGAGGVAGGVQRASDYDQSCQDDTNCALVNEGTVCDCDSCSNAAIDSGAVSQWNSDRASFNCKALPCAFMPCPTVVASCAKGTCIARKPLVVAADSYDRACSSTTDCVAIMLGDPCSTCQCSLGAVSNKGYEAYKLDVAAARAMCTPPPVGCGCAPAGKPACSTTMGPDGVCVIQ